MTKQRGIKNDIIEDLPGLLTEAGFNVVAKNPYDIDFDYNAGQPEPFVGAQEYWYKSTPYALSSAARELGLMNELDWQKFEDGIKDEYQLVDKSKLVMRAWVLVAQASRCL
jgi:hypothetical protein